MLDRELFFIESLLIFKTNMPQRKNRYPGIRSFEADDQILFNGRSKEIDELFNLIKIKPLVVLFGKSGLGKTSLLKAGVGPLLLQQHYYPMMIRLQDTNVPPSVSVLNALEKYIDNSLLKEFGNKTKNEIWETLNASSFKTATGAPATPILIFDQFEELFNHSKKIQEKFTADIGDLIENRLPADIENALNQVPRSQRTPELMAWFRPPNVKIVFAIRSDRMSELHKMRFEIPAILQNRYELKPLLTQQAKDAIEKPAALSGGDYNTLPFSYAPQTIEKIQKELSNEFGEIESFQLQIICQYIERTVRKEQTEGKQNIEVKLNYLGEEEGIRGILKNYYNNQISLLGTNEEQTLARQLIEEALIVNKRRISIAEAVVKENYNINDDLLEKLLASRLIRPEDTRLGRTYEISHDTLVKPILDAFQKRKKSEEHMEEVRLRLRTEKKQKRARYIAFVNFFIALGCVIGLLFVINYYKGAEQAKDDAVIAKDAAEKAMKMAESAKDSLNQLKDSLEIQQEAMKIQQDELEKTKTELEDALKNSGRKAKKELEKINSSRRTKLNNDIFSKNEAQRVAARRTVQKDYKNDAKMIGNVLDASRGKINAEYQNSIYQIVYLLEQSSPESLKKEGNAKKVKAFIDAVRKAKLAGASTEARFKKIEKKLK